MSGESNRTSDRILRRPIPGGNREAAFMTGSASAGANKQLRFVSTFSALFAVMVASLVLVGWTLQVESLKRVLPDLVAMNPLTALCFILAGVSLWGLSNGGFSRFVPQL